jgi:hypothetical protein
MEQVYRGGQPVALSPWHFADMEFDAWDTTDTEHNIDSDVRDIFTMTNPSGGTAILSASAKRADGMRSSCARAVTLSRSGWLSCFEGYTESRSTSKSPNAADAQWWRPRAALWSKAGVAPANRRWCDPPHSLVDPPHFPPHFGVTAGTLR